MRTESWTRFFRRIRWRRVACEVTAATGQIFIMGEITTETYVDFAAIARKTILDIGYTSSEMGFDGNTCAVISCVHEQSPDIALGVDKSMEAKQSEGETAENENGAGDQGMMFGYACSRNKRTDAPGRSVWRISLLRV